MDKRTKPSPSSQNAEPGTIFALIMIFLPNREIRFVIQLSYQ
jgi:hypothetical protein